MQKPVINASYDFIFAKLHGMWANAAKDAKLSALINAGTEDELVRLLGEYKLDASKRELFHKNLILREINALSGISSQLDQKTAAFYRSFVERTYFENLKALLHYKFFPERASEITHLMVSVPGIPDIPVASLLESDSIDVFLQELRPALYPTEISDIVRKLAEDKNIMTAECELDKLAYRHMLTYAERVPGGVRAACAKLVKTEIDIVNLRMLMRIVRTYRLDADTVKPMWISGGTLAEDTLTALSEQETVTEMVMKLPSAFRDLLEPFTEAELYLSENALWKMLYKYAKKLFADYNEAALSIVAFPFLQHFETLNLGRIYEGIRYGIRPADMTDMMISDK